MTMNASFTLLFFVLGLAGASILLVYIGASIYYKRKQAQFWDSVEKLEGKPQTEAERAAYEQYDLIDVEIEGDPTMGPASQAEIAKDAAEMVALFKQRERSERQQTLDYDEIETNTPFMDLDGQKYKFVDNPNYEPTRKDSKPRVKMKLSGAVSNSNAIPFPNDIELSRIMKRQAVEAVENIDGNVLNIDSTVDGACEICGLGNEHSHSGGEVRRLIFDRAETTFKKYVQDMDLTKLPAEDVQKLWARCKARIEHDASLSTMLALDSLFVRAQLLAVDDAEDNAFYKQACLDAEAGPVTKCDKPAPAGYADCTRNFGHSGPCALPKYVKTCGNCEDLDTEDRLVENCGCGMDTHPFLESTPSVKAQQPIPMPKRFMEGITRQLSQENAYEGLKGFGEKLAEGVEEEDRHKVFAGVGELMTKLKECEIPAPNLKDLATEYEHLTDDELLMHSQAILAATTKRHDGDEAYKALFDKFVPVKDPTGGQYVRDPFWFQFQQLKLQQAQAQTSSETRDSIINSMKKNLAEHTGRKPEEFVVVPGEPKKLLTFDIAKAIEELEYDRKFVEDAERKDNEHYPSKPKRKPKMRTAELRKSDLKKKRPRKK